MNSALTEFHGSKSKVTAEQIEKFLLTDKRTICHVAEADGEIVGFVTVYDRVNFEFGTLVSVVDLLYTTEKFRRRGVALALMHQAAVAAVARGCCRLEVGAAKDNPMSNAFYQKAGFYLRKENTNRYVLQGEGLAGFVK